MFLKFVFACVRGGHSRFTKLFLSGFPLSPSYNIESEPYGLKSATLGSPMRHKHKTNFDFGPSGLRDGIEFSVAEKAPPTVPSPDKLNANSELRSAWAQRTTSDSGVLR